MYVENFRSDGHKGFLNEASVTFVDNAEGKDSKKEKDIGCEQWKRWNIMVLILQIVCSQLILHYAKFLSMITT